MGLLLALVNVHDRVMREPSFAKNRVYVDWMYFVTGNVQKERIAKERAEHEVDFLWSNAREFEAGSASRRMQSVTRSFVYWIAFSKTNSFESNSPSGRGELTERGER